MIHSCTVQYSLYQFHLETRNAVPGAVLYGTFQFNPGWCSILQSAEVKLRLRQSSPVKCSAVHFNHLKRSPAQSSPVHSLDVRSSPFRGICARLVQSSPVQSRPVQYCSFPFNSNSFPSSRVHLNPS